jgi:hypothetical protein
MEQNRTNLLLCRLAGACLALFALGLWLVDDASEATQLHANGLIETTKHDFESARPGCRITELKRGAKPNELIGKAIVPGYTAQQPETVLLISAKFENGRILIKGRNIDGGHDYTASLSQTSRDWRVYHPRFWLFLHAIGFCIGIVGIVFSLLQAIGWRRSEARITKKQLLWCLPVYFGMAATQVFPILTLIQHLTAASPTFI